MKSPQHFLMLGVTCVLSCFLAGCASIGAPVPPSLELPKPPNDLRAVRKGDHVYLFWTVPTQTIDRQTAFVWTNADSVEVSKVLVKFLKDFKGLALSGGLIEGVGRFGSLFQVGGRVINRPEV